MAVDISNRQGDSWPQARPRILVVDDEPAIVDTLAVILETQGYETLQALSGEEAVRLAAAFQPDLLLSDVVMGKLDGIEAATLILRAFPRCQVLFVSGNAHYRRISEEAKLKGFTAEVLAKPVPPRELLALISQMLSFAAGKRPTDRIRLAAPPLPGFADVS